MTRLEQLRDNTETAYAGPKWVDEIAAAVAQKLSGQSLKPDSTDLQGRIRAWQRMRQSGRPETQSGDGRPSIEISPEALWLRPEQTQQVGNKIVPKEEPSMYSRPGYPLEFAPPGWSRASIRSAAAIRSQRQGLEFHEPEDRDPSPGPGISGERPRTISW